MMKGLFFGLVLLLTARTAQAQDHGLYWKYKDYDGAIAVTVPGFAVHIGSWFIDGRENRQLIRKIGKVRVLVFEDGNPISDRDARRFARKAKRRGLEELMTVREGKTHIRVMAKERRNGKGLRKVVVFVNSPDDGFALISVRGRLRYDDIGRILKEYSGKKQDGKQGPIPEVVKVPVSRV